MGCGIVVCALLVSLLVIMRYSEVRIFLTVWNILTHVNGDAKL